MSLPTGAPPRSYSVLLPPGWQRVPVDDGARQVLRSILDEAFADVPRDTAAPFRGELEKALLAQVDSARRENGIDLYLPVGGLRGRPIAASFVVSHLPPPDGPGDPVELAAEVVAQLAESAPAGEPVADGSAGGDDAGARERTGGAGQAEDGLAPTELVTVAGMPSVRLDRQEQPQLRPLFGVERPSRRITYVVPVPGGAGFVLVAFSTLVSEPSAGPDGAPEPLLSDALVTLFDAVMTTFRWR